MIRHHEASQSMLIQESLSAAYDIFRECGQHGAAEMTWRFLRMLIINGVGCAEDGTAIISPEIVHGFEIIRAQLQGGHIQRWIPDALEVDEAA